MSQTSLMEIEGIVVYVKKRHTRIKLADKTKIDLFYRKSDNYIVSQLEKGELLKAQIKVKSIKIGKFKLGRFDLMINHNPFKTG